MIEEEAGVYQVKRLIKSISKPPIDSPVIARLNELGKENRQRHIKKWERPQ
jgi:hypothetical protein